MSYTVSQPSVGASVGAGIGKSLAELVPKEVERYRLSKGLQQLSQQQGLSPFEQFSKLAAIPGITPQMIESGANLLRQQAQSQAANKGMTANEFPLPARLKEEEKPSNIPSVTKRRPLEEAIEPYLPKSQDELIKRGAVLFNENPALYKHDFNLALQAAENEEARNLQRSQALQAARKSQQDVERTVKNKLGEVANKYNVKTTENPQGTSIVPGQVLADVESKALNAVLPKSEGGEGLTEEQTSKIYGKELDEIGREYSDLNTLSQLNRGEFHRRINELQKKFEKRDDQRNFAQSLISTQGISPSFAYSLAYPPKGELKAELDKMRDIKKTGLPLQKLARKSYENLFNAMGTEGSPLSIAHALQLKGYDPSDWLKFAGTKMNKLSVEQADELTKGINIRNPINDIWLQFWR